MEKKVILSYSVNHYSDGSVEVDPIEVDGTAPTKEECYDDIETVAKMIKETRISNRVYTATQQAIGDFFKTMAAAKTDSEEN